MRLSGNLGFLMQATSTGFRNEAGIGNTMSGSALKIVRLRKRNTTSITAKKENPLIIFVMMYPSDALSKYRRIAELHVAP